MAGVLVFLATRNEAGNVTSLLPAIRERVPDADVLVVDDESNDARSMRSGRSACHA